MKKVRVLALYRERLFESRGTPIRVLNILSRIEHDPRIELSVFSWDASAPGFARHMRLMNNHLEDLCKLRRYIKEHKIDIVVGYTASSLYYLTPLKFLTKAKISFESHGFIEDEALAYGDISPWKYKLLRAFFGFSYRLCDVIFTSDGKSTADALARYNPAVSMLTGGVDTGQFRPDAPSGHYFERDTRIVIGYAGNARIWQGVDFLVEAYRALGRNSGFRLVLLLSEQKSFGDDIEAFGPLPNPEVPGFLTDCDLLVIPRPLTPVTRIAYPSKLTEYLAMGKAVIGSDVGDIDTIIRDGENGLIYPAGDAQALRHCLERLRDPALRAQLGKNGRATAEKMSWDTLAKRMVDRLIEAA
jgi:glycosyltransferase involved in cell wall biosynthesis